MSTLKERVPNEASLEALVEECTPEVYKQVKGAASKQEWTWKWHRLLFGLSLIPTVLVYVLFSVWPVSPDSYSKYIVLVFLIAFAGTSFWFLNKMIKSKMAFDKAVNRVLFKEVFRVMGLSGRLSQVSNLSVGETLDRSELITESKNTVIADDKFSIDTDHSSVFVYELNVTNVISFGNRYSYTKHIFNGYFAHLELPRPLVGKTFVSTEGDESGFGHSSFWTKLVGGKVNETVLEWNEFENLLHVATTDESEARYVLTPDFMQNLYDWWTEQKTNIRLSFIADHMYILFPDKKVRVDSTVSGLSKRKVRKYMLTIARPLLHVVNLVEGVRG